MKKLYVLQHAESEPLGVWEEELKRWYARFEYVRLWQGQPLPQPEDTLAAIVLGGSMNVDDTEQHPFLIKELEYLRRLLEMDVHVLGVCLGAQLMAAALGAQVTNGPRAEIGYSRVMLTYDGVKDALLLGFPMELPVFQWHEQGFELPQGAIRLASTDEYPNQAFRHGHAWGFQFHLEVTPEMAEGFAREHEETLVRLHGLSRHKLAEQAGTVGQVASLYGRQLIRRFWDSVTEV
ncbi:MAG: type 1 glutamine amidotransferase [candidate division FCPU426 bacterium]